MKILIISQWFDPEPTFKGLLFAKELTRLGHDVRVLTGFPNYPGGVLYDGYRIRPYQYDYVDNVSVIRVPLFPSHDDSALRRILNYTSFAASATIASLLISKPDVVYVYHPPATVGLPALVMKWLRGVPFVYDIQDLWPDSLAATAMIRGDRLMSVITSFMNTVYSSAARLIVLSDGFASTLVRRGVPAEKLQTIFNWADESQIDLHSTPSEKTEDLNFGRYFNVVFAGTMGKAQDLDTVLSAAKMTQNQPEIRFVLIGGGVEVGRLKKHCESMDLRNVLFLPRRPLSEIGEILGLAQALLVHLRDEPLFAITVPSKTQAYMMAGRPLLMGVRGDAADLVSRAKAGLTFEPGSPEALAGSVRALFSMNETERSEMGVNGAAFYRAHLSMTTGVGRIESVLCEASLVRPRRNFFKRVFDITASTVLAVALAAPTAAVAITVRCKIGEPALFRQTRPGLNGVPFEIVKFRTMTDARDSEGQHLPDSQRITPFGALLRASSLDELPELWNVLRGHMSLVGPRPLLVRYTEFFTAEERLRLQVRPGITGWAQVNGRNKASWDSRLAMDSWYVRNQSMKLDVKILLSTIVQASRRTGVVIDPESIMRNLDDERRSMGVTA